MRAALCFALNNGDFYAALIKWRQTVELLRVEGMRAYLERMQARQRQRLRFRGEREKLRRAAGRERGGCPRAGGRESDLRRLRHCFGVALRCMAGASWPAWSDA